MKDGREHVGKDCTLDGVPARVLGRLLDYAVVMDDNGRRHEWSWDAVSRIMENGGRFKT